MKEIVLDLAEVSQMASIDNQLVDFGVVGHIGGRSDHTLVPPIPHETQESQHRFVHQPAGPTSYIEFPQQSALVR